MNAAKAISFLMMVLCMYAGPAYAFPPITSPNEVVVSVRDFTQVPSTSGVVSFRVTIELCTGADTSNWGTFSPKLFHYGILVSSATAGTLIPLCGKGTTNCPHPPNSQCIRYAFAGNIPFTDPRMNTGESAVINISLDFVVQPSNPNIRFINEEQEAVAGTLRSGNLQNYLGDKPKVLDKNFSWLIGVLGGEETPEERASEVLRDFVTKNHARELGLP